MMQRHARAAEFFEKHGTTLLNFLQVGRAKRVVSRLWKDEIGYFQIAHRTAVWRRERVDFFCDPQRRFAHLIVRPDISHDRGIELIAKSDHRVVTYSPGIFRPRKNP